MLGPVGTIEEIVVLGQSLLHCLLQSVDAFGKRLFRIRRFFKRTTNTPAVDSPQTVGPAHSRPDFDERGSATAVV